MCVRHATALALMEMEMHTLVDRRSQLPQQEQSLTTRAAAQEVARERRACGNPRHLAIVLLLLILLDIRLVLHLIVVLVLLGIHLGILAFAFPQNQEG